MTNRIDLHPEAFTRFAELGRELVQAVLDTATPWNDPQARSFFPEFPVVHTITDDQIDSVRMHTIIDDSGAAVARRFSVDNRKLAITGPTLHLFDDVCQRLYKLPTLH